MNYLRSLLRRNLKKERGERDIVMRYILFGNLDADMHAVLKNIPYEVDYIVTNRMGQSEYEGKKVYTSVKLFEEKNNVYIYVTDLLNYVDDPDAELEDLLENRYNWFFLQYFKQVLAGPQTNCLQV